MSPAVTLRWPWSPGDTGPTHNGGAVLHTPQPFLGVSPAAGRLAGSARSIFAHSGPCDRMAQTETYCRGSRSGPSMVSKGPPAQTPPVASQGVGGTLCCTLTTWSPPQAPPPNTVTLVGGIRREFGVDSNMPSTAQSCVLWAQAGTLRPGLRGPWAPRSLKALCRYLGPGRGNRNTRDKWQTQGGRPFDHWILGGREWCCLPWRLPGSSPGMSEEAS